jgi:hypothetical protein
MLSDLVMPYLTEADPDLLGEGSLDPLGLASLADRLADEIAPGVTARMNRVRFLTGIAVSASVTEGMDELPPGDGVSTPYLVFEWHVVTALAREDRLPPEATAGVPGIMKARASLAHGKLLDAASYLKAPKVFGFVGVYKRLARALGIVDEGLLLTERGDALLRTWEREQDFDGFADRRSGTEGGSFARALQNVVRSAYREGRITEPLSGYQRGKIVRGLRPDMVGVTEKKLIWQWLLDEAAPMRRELLSLLRKARGFETEAEVLRLMRQEASDELALRLDAIDAYERVAEFLTRSLDAVQFVCTGGEGPISHADIAKHPIARLAARELQNALKRAREVLDRLDPSIAFQFEDVVSMFHGIDRPQALVDALLARHDAVQAAKGGKRPWFERTERGLIVRPPYRLDEQPEVTGTYVHPYRIWALNQFIGDLR